METTASKFKPVSKAALVALGTAFGIIGALCIIFHLSPKEIGTELSEFARHHYFLAGFFCLVFAMISFRLYFISTRPAVNYSNSLVKQKGRTRRRLRVMMQNLRRTIEPYNEEPKSVYVDKLAIDSLKLSGAEVLADPTERDNRKQELLKALSLGNLYKQKVIICFYDARVGIRKHTLATIWHVDDENVSLKGGSVIPVKSIYKIEL